MMDFCNTIVSTKSLNVCIFESVFEGPVCEERKRRKGKDSKERMAIKVFS